MALYRFFFIQMIFRYGQGVSKAVTRLWFAPIGPLLVAGGVASALLKGPPAITVSTFLAGSSIMRIQASMVERCPWKSLRNGAVLVAALVAAIAYFTKELVWPGVGMAIAVALLVLHVQHEKMLVAKGLTDPQTATYAEQLGATR